MNRIASIEKMLEAARQSLADQRQAEAESEDVFAAASLNSMQVHVAELQHDLALAKAEHGKQVLSFKLNGPRLNDGSIPLHLLSRLSSLIERSMGYASYRIQNGREATRRIPEEIRRTLDLRLADVAMGSTELVITGNTSPDLTGESLLENSLSTVFRVLNAEPTSVAQEAAEAGSMASRMIARMLTELEAENCTVDMVWTDSADRVHRWTAAPERVALVRQNLQLVTVRPPETFAVVGAVTLLSASGRIEVMDDDGRKISAKFPRDLFDRVRHLKLGQRLSFSFERTTTTNVSVGQTLEDYTLLGFSFGDELGSIEYLTE
ncbi:hypothetical protein JAK62_13805 [Stenotrophomonas maltophilia]|uniref:hypothetical protein n=1 Tax=Stenotrophomonas maltophilia TaxID=40324 RepID=UPI0011B7DD6E|nr:hypothetical protein [Stenotrophomonas maltophilia]MBH1499355.1 hypothetical protein [Stenotrophomonas maltophilia]MBH1534767.1 hypothetical protein [Stenotrophomonas maltophilia]MBN5000478.1 hypothetical protein [Stenotrophomonas maltophilia]MBN5007115.1 hypothetical protein [Stenotrophomonas maltophilia]MCI1158299.1 hypothetical protein [Stenotrophomonas maltophilia]